MKVKVGKHIVIIDDRFSWILEKYYLSVTVQKKFRSTEYFQVKCKQKSNTNKVYILSHLIIGEPESGFVTDHKNNSSLDNRKNNLRFITFQQNAWNKCKQKTWNKKKTTSRFKGVSFKSGSNLKPWCARITCSGKTKNIGYFETEKEAAKAYNSFAKKLFGQYAILNGGLLV